MIRLKVITEAMEILQEDWDRDGENVILACARENPYNKTIKEFLSECTACGGDWGQLLLTGIRKVYPKVYDVIPNDMGLFVWRDLCAVLILLGVDTSE